MPREDGQDGETDMSIEGTDGRQEAAEARFPALTERAFYNLVTAGQWMRFIGIFSFVSYGLILIVGFISIFGRGTLYFMPDYYEGVGRLTGLSYIVVSLVFFFPAMFLFLAGSNLCALRRGGGEDFLEAALQSNKSYWKFNGIIVIIGLASIVLGLLAAVIAVVVS